MAKNIAMILTSEIKTGKVYAKNSSIAPLVGLPQLLTYTYQYFGQN